ncbi:ketosteroid isomerase-like protein [Rhizomicrobium palustre]|uniref:Ketosteroid isomerase-like protein n=1 Tax=Rhizomicrobium palustre TaxID=189966 RepID=A0A846MXQ6_9PROT|nr:DUF4440 domain-containing protein [Rhizomicrobium palustre]NIK88083.1 ketosteroid isomerase-like protein [Rhizomicrobium palustre]
MRPAQIFAALATLAAATMGAYAAPKDELIATDKAFSEMSAEKGMHAAFLAYMTDDARLFQGPTPPLSGKAAIAAAFAEEEKSPHYKAQKLTWTPLEAEASSDGTLGWTRGTWVYTVPGEKDAPIKVTGYYVTEWRRQTDGSYKFCLDIGGADKH